MAQYIFVVDLDRCIGCKACQVACKLENEIGLGISRNVVKKIGPTGKYPNLEMYFMPFMCQQCENPMCVEVCPTGACYKNEEDGIILIDQKKCISCMCCQRACPYEANILNKELRVMDKCSMCVQLRSDDEKPACVKNCPGRALNYGDINDPESIVSKLLNEVDEKYIHNLRDFGNKPSVRYILRDAEWKDILPQECEEQEGRRKTWM